MLRRGNGFVKRLADDSSDLPEAVLHTENERMRMTNSNASLELTVFGGESRITEQLQNIDAVSSGFKVSPGTRCDSV